MDFVNGLIVLCNFVMVPATAYGGQLALGALGLTLIHRVLRFQHFAHGDMMAFGTMVTILVTWVLQGAGVTVGPLPTALLALPAGIGATALLALGADRAVYRFYRRRKASPILMVVVSAGVMFVLNGLVRLVIGPGDRRFADGERFIVRAREFKEMTGLPEGITVSVPQVLTLAATITALAGLHWFLARTRTGKSMRAYADNPDLAFASGIDSERVVMVVWVIAAGLATLAGVLYGLDKSFKPLTYFS